MDYFQYKNGELHAEDVGLTGLAQDFGTPCYVYSRATIERHWRAFDQALEGYPHLICYAVKANSNIAVLNILARLGSGFDIVSVGELERVLRAGGDANKVVFSGVGKRHDELHRALEAGIRCFNVESSEELERLNEVAATAGQRAPVSLRVNPDVDANTHPYISTGLKDNKFGIEVQEAIRLFQRAAEMEHIEVMGIDCHIGSQLTETRPFVDALDRVLELVDSLDNKGIKLHHLDIGGGLGIRYKNEEPPEPQDYAAEILAKLQGRSLEIIMEPGRAIAGNAGILLTRVEYLKCTAHKNFAIVDAAMNDILRPALYGAWQDIIPVRLPDKSIENQEMHANDRIYDRTYDIVGPVCETGDFLGKDRNLSLSQGDLLAVRSSGAYGFTMSSNYNSRPRVAEVMVDGSQIHLVRKRETIDDLMVGESILPD